MTEIERPDLAGLNPAQLAYVENLEQELARLRDGAAATPEGDALAYLTVIDEGHNLRIG